MSASVFYILGLTSVVTTLMAITRREMIHAVVYLVLSFFSLALIFFMLGAPFIAAIEVLIYAGAIMVLFLFIVMMLEMGGPSTFTTSWKAWGPAALFAAVILICASLLFASSAAPEQAIGAAFISPRAFGQALFSKYMLAVEAASLLLLFALVGALYLGRRD
jgi:NADH-quinone oxidoreductase subunit J